MSVFGARCKVGKLELPLVSDRLLHLIRHGEVHNPAGVLYGRLPGFGLSQRGVQMAQAAAAELVRDGRGVAHLVASPLQRTQESAAPVAEAFGLSVELDERAIEPYNQFEGQARGRGGSAFLRPRYWGRLRNPFRPSWGEPYKQIAARMLAAMDAAWEAAPAGVGDVVIVSHQSPIWMAHLAIAGQKLWHNPATRRCELSSITSFAKRDGRWVEVDYRSPAAGLLASAVDVGAV